MQNLVSSYFLNLAKISILGIPKRSFITQRQKEIDAKSKEGWKKRLFPSPASNEGTGNAHSINEQVFTQRKKRLIKPWVMIMLGISFYLMYFTYQSISKLTISFGGKHFAGSLS